MSGVSRGCSGAGKSRDGLERRGYNGSVCSCHLPLLCLSPKPSFPSVSEWRMWPRTLHYKRGITHISRFWGLVACISVLKNGAFMWIVEVEAAVLRWNPPCYIQNLPTYTFLVGANQPFGLWLWWKGYTEWGHLGGELHFRWGSRWHFQIRLNFDESLFKRTETSANENLGKIWV